MSRAPDIVTSSTSVYVEAVLDDGRIMIIPAHAIPASSVPQQNIQPIQIHSAVVPLVQRANIIPTGSNTTTVGSNQINSQFHARVQPNQPILPNSIHLQPLLLLHCLARGLG